MRTQTTDKPAQSPSRQQPEPDTLLLTPGHIRQFLSSLEQSGRSPATINTYQGNLHLFCGFLGETWLITAQTLPLWQAHLIQEGYSRNSVNSRVSAVNSLYQFLQKRNWQIPVGTRAPADQGPELTRGEYHQLLRAARSQDNIQLYLLIKVMASTDLIPSDMPLLTRESVSTGCVTGKRQGSEGPAVLPPPLQEELLEYARKWGIQSGPIFINDLGVCYNRTAINRMVRLLGESLDLAPGKANPRNLRRLYLNTLADFQRQADVWVKTRCLQLLEEEETLIGWRCR